MFKPGQSGNPKGRPKGHGLSYWLGKVLEEEIKSPFTGMMMTKYEALARKLVEAGIKEEIEPKDLVKIFSEIADRKEGKPVAVNINADMPYNPLADIDTTKLEKLRNDILSKDNKDGVRND